MQVAMEKTKGNLSKAIELLRAYVDTFMMDREAWEELAELYLQVCCRLCCSRRKPASTFTAPLFSQAFPAEDHLLCN